MSTGIDPQQLEKVMNKRLVAPAGILTWIIVTFSALVSAEEPRDGIHGMLWNSPVEQHTHLTKIRDNAPVAYYINSNMSYMVSNQPVPGVIYGFTNGRFFAVYIKLRSPDQFFNLKRHFTARYGGAKEDHSDQVQQTVYRWADEDIKIKLKMTESTGNIKLAIYYLPLASKLNEELVENLPAGTPETTLSEGKEKNKLGPLFNDR